LNHWKLANENAHRFTGPKITLDISELSEAQEQALREEGLDIQIEGIDHTPVSAETDFTSEKKEPRV
jgi:hypothetical protein